MTARRIGLFGGSFDPVHRGHLGVAEGVLQRCELDELHFIPCFQHALGKSAGASAGQRVEMLEIAIASSESAADFSIDTRELTRSGPSYSVETCTDIREAQGPDCQLVFIVGSDIPAQLHRWHQWQRLPELVNLLVVERASTTGTSETPVWESGSGSPLALQQWRASHSSSFDQPAGQYHRLRLPPYPLSSTAVRRQLADWHSRGERDPHQLREVLRTAVDENVLSYIMDHQLYR